MQMEENILKMEKERREKDDRENQTTRSSSRASFCYYCSLRKPYEFLGAVGRAIMECLHFHKTPESGGRNGGGGGGAGAWGDPTSTADDPPISASGSATVVRSYAIVSRSTEPPTPPVNKGSPPQIHEEASNTSG